MKWLAIVVAASALAQTVNKDAATLADFKKRVDGYIALHQRVAGKIGPLDPTKSPKEIAEREKNLGLAIAGIRSAAKQGEIITPDAGVLFRAIIKDEFAHRSKLALKDREEAQDELPNFTPRVNQVYPTTYPLATFPPGVLRQLPPLPKPLEYRFVQRSLIVRDGEANLIVDVLPAAAPVVTGLPPTGRSTK